MTHLAVCLLGNYQVTRGSNLVTEFASNKVRALLAYLAVESNHAQPRETLAALLWPDSSQESALSSLRNALANLRGVIGDREADPPYLLITHDTLQFNRRSDFSLDIDHFLKLGADCLRPFTPSQPADIERRINAVNAYRGQFLSGFSIPDSAPFEEWAIIWRERLSQRVREELGWLVDFYGGCAEYILALDFAQRQLALEPWLEEGHRQVMRIQACMGQRSVALAQFENCKRILADELGVDPSIETRQIYETIRLGRLEDLLPDRMFPAPGLPPYRGLCFFDEPDAALFFGREVLSARLAARVEHMALSAGPQLAVVGSSGSGKSSLVRAGVAPLLRKKGWKIRVMTPTANPLAVLEGDGAWPDSKGARFHQHLLIIDQLEELFSLCHEEEMREAFLNRVFTVNLPVLFVLRADFYERCAQYARLRDMLSTGQVYIGVMDSTGLRRAIEEPARRGGWELQPGLVDLLLDEVKASGDHAPEAGALPLLEHALLETWQRRRGRVLTLAGYQESGGVRGAIAQTAERVYRCLSTADQALARRIFLRLTELGEGNQDTRRRAPLGELRAIGEGEIQVDGLLDAMAAARLVTLTEQTAEVTHEALIREWPALQGWLAEDRDGLRLHRHLTDSTAAWEQMGREESELYRGARLSQAQEWAGQEEHQQGLTPAEREFLQASQASEEREAFEREVQRQRELQAAVQLAETERRRAEEREQAALELYRQERLSYAHELSAHVKSKLATQPDLSLLLALEAVAVLKKAGLPISWEVQQVVHDVALAWRLVWSRATPTQPWTVRYSPEGGRVLYEDRQDIHVLDAVCGEEIFYLHAEGSINAIFSPDGRYIAASNPQRACLWDAATGEKRVSFPLASTATHHGRLNALSPDGRLLHVNIDETTGILLDLSPWFAAGSPSMPTFSLPMKKIEPCPWDNSIAFSPDGKTFVMSHLEDHTYILFDTDTLQPLRTLAGHQAFPMTISFSPDGRRLASCSFDKTVRIWDAVTAQELLRLVGHTNWVSWVAYSPDGSQLASSGKEGQVIVWNAADGNKLFLLPTGGEAFGVAYSPDGERLFTSQLSGSVQMWDVTPCGPGELGSMRSSGPIRQLSGDGTLILDSRSDSTVVLLDLATFHRLDCLKIPMEVLIQECTFSLSCDNTQLAVAHSKNLMVWDLRTQNKVFDRSAGEGEQFSRKFVFSPDGKRLAIAMHPGTVSVWNLTNEHPDLVFPVTLGYFFALEFSPNGRFLAVGGELAFDDGLGGDVWIWDLEYPAKPPLVFRGDLRAVRHLTFSSDSRHLALCGSDSHAEIRDVSRGDCLLFLRGHTSIVRSIRYSPDGRFLVTASEDGTAKVWDANSGLELLSYHVPGQNMVEMACFTPDSRRVVTGGDDGYYRLLAFQDFEELLDIVSKRVTRDWKPEERRKYLRQ